MSGGSLYEMPSGKLWYTHSTVYLLYLCVMYTGRDYEGLRVLLTLDNVSLFPGICYTFEVRVHTCTELRW